MSKRALLYTIGRCINSNNNLKFNLTFKMLIFLLLAILNIHFIHKVYIQEYFEKMPFAALFVKEKE